MIKHYWKTYCHENSHSPVSLRAYARKAALGEFGEAARRAALSWFAAKGQAVVA